MPSHSHRLACALACVSFFPLAAAAQDFAEGNAANWAAFAPIDNAPRSVTNDSSRARVGSSSILFTTQSGFDTGVKFPAAANWNFNASAFNTLLFWEYPVNTTPIGWQGNQPIVVVRTGTGVITLTPSSQLTSNHAWKLFKVPLAGGFGWERTTTGSPNLADVDQIEIHHDTWDAGFTINFDGVRFASLDPDGLPPAGPPPPPGVDPDAIEPRVLLYVLDPIMENFGGLRMHQVYGWQDPLVLAQQVRQDLLASSHGRARYQIVETQLVDGYPRFADGFQHNDQTFAADWAARIFHEGTFDYVGFGQSNDLPARVDAGDFDEVWVYAPPIGGMWEAAMLGQGAYWVNGVPYPAGGGQRAFVVMGWNFERGVGEAIHSFGHRCESTMADKVYGQWCQTGCNTWSRFALLDINQPGQGGVGNVHYPVNATSDYDYGNPRFVLSNADAWLNYPNLNDTTRSINFHEWSPDSADMQREYLNWWYAHMPHAAGRAPDFYLANWWRYLCDIDQFKNGSANLRFTLGIPEVRLTAPTSGDTVSGTVTVRATAEVDGALGRVDFYVDGQYTATDTIAPYRFEWNTGAIVPGPHTLVARAYELQNGTESVSSPVQVVVAVAPCPADFNIDGFVNPDDLADFITCFFLDIQFPGTCAESDFNRDTFRDPDDLSDFITAFFTSTC